MNLGQRYLRDPDRFRELVDDEARTFGEVSHSLRLGPGKLNFLGLSARQHDTLLGIAQHPSPGSDLAININARSIPRAVFSEIDWRGRAYDLEFDYQPDHIFWAGDGFVARLALPEDLVELWTMNESGAEFLGMVHNLMRVAVAYGLLHRGGVLLHASGVVLNHAAQLFCGRSGAGKSTVALSAVERDYSVLSDDLNAIVRHSDRFAVAAVPFTGDLDESAVVAEKVLLGRLYWLERAREDDIEDLSPGQATANLIACAPFVNRDPYRYERLFAVITSLMAQYPMYRLRFGKPVNFWDMLRGEKHHGLA